MEMDVVQHVQSNQGGLVMEAHLTQKLIAY
jgi:hypothetical protein